MMFSIKFVVRLAILLFAVSGEIATAQDLSLRIRTAVEAKDWPTVRSNLESLRSSDPSVFAAKEYEYLLGRVAEETADFALAISKFETIASSNSLLSEYALWRLARIARSNGDLVLERERLRRLISSAPESLLLDSARLRLVESFFESSDFAGVSASAAQAMTTRNVSVARQSAVLLGRSNLRAGKLVEARDVFNKLVMQMPDASRPDDFALTAVRELDELGKRASVPAAPLSEADHLLRASVYQFNRDFGAARVHYQAVVDGNPQSGTVPNALFQIGRGLYSEAKYEEANRFFQKVIDQFPQTPSGKDALSYLSASYIRLKRIDDAFAAYKLFITRFPDGPNLDRTYLNLIDALHEGGKYSEALSWVQQARTRFKNDIGEALALFAQLRIHLAQSDWASVIRDAGELARMSDLGGIRVSGGTTLAEVNFLRAFALEQLGRTEEAITSYLAIPDGRNEYYGQRATQRLLQLSTNALVANKFQSYRSAAQTANANGKFDEARLAAQTAIRLTQDSNARKELIQLLRGAYAALPNYKLPAFQLTPLASDASSASSSSSRHQQLGERLFLLGLYDEAMPEFFAAQRATQTPAANTTQKVEFSNAGYSTAIYALRGGLTNRAVRFAEQLWRTMPGDYVLDAAPRELAELLYPTPFRDSLLKHATSRNVDPRFMLAIIRTESRYQVDVKSVAAARGMMQFIPATANEIAVQLKLQNFTQDDLYRADTAILFGSQYLANLFQQFPNQPQAVAGSYNGGPDNLARWIARSKANEADRYVPEIGFSQTRDYVWKVLADFWNYQRLYDAQLQPLTK
jgi:soluble lytic murein transglycosylase-like protein/Tfp pilus assembly protein PilF